jgi:hypothetical protein
MGVCGAKGSFHCTACTAPTAFKQKTLTIFHMHFRELQAVVNLTEPQMAVAVQARVASHAVRRLTDEYSSMSSTHASSTEGARQHAAAHITVVTTPSELLQALHQGTEHAEVQEHLNMTGLSTANSTF